MMSRFAEILVAVFILCVVLIQAKPRHGFKSTQNQHTGERIVHGWPALPNQFPHMVYIRIVTNTGWRGCGGSLIAPNYVLSAAHCLERGINVTAYLGSNDRDNASVIVATDKFTIHPDYDDYWAYNDVGIIDLLQNVPLSESIKVIALPKWSHLSETFEGRQASTSGWGWMADIGPLSQYMNYANVSVISNRLCTDLYNAGSIEGFEMKNFTVCTLGIDLPAQGICNGDSGGAMVLEDDGVLIQIGISSFGGNQGCLSDLPNGYVRPHHYWPFISNYTGIPIRM